jgi:hypothetical protein
MQIECSLNITCPRRWEELEVLPSNNAESMRHCLECGHNVTLCQTPEEIARARMDGKCFAFPMQLQEATRY